MPKPPSAAENAGTPVVATDPTQVPTSKTTPAKPKSEPAVVAPTATAVTAKAAAATTTTPTAKAPAKAHDIPVEPVRPRRQSRPPSSNNNGKSMNNRSKNNYKSNGNSNQYGGNQYGRNYGDAYEYEDEPANYGRSSQDGDGPTETLTGILDLSRDGHGVLRVNYSTGERDAYISTSQIRRFKLRPGDIISGPAREPKENERYWGILQVDHINGEPAEKMVARDRVKFHSLTPVYPDQQIVLETGEDPISTRIIDLVAPIGKGQRSLIVSPPKAGKTTLLKEVATGIAKNYPDIHLMAVLVGERPEEVTDIRRHIDKITGGKGETAASNFDEHAQEQCRVAELALERAKRMVEEGRDVVILLDSITRLARAYNLAMPTSGRTLSGGFDPQALFPPKKFFGAARNFEVPGSLTIVGTALIETGSKMDEVIFEEFKGTGNQEIHLDRRLAERRIYPAIDVQRSGTRRDDLLINSVQYQSVTTLHRMLDMVNKEERTETLLEQMKRSKSNKEFLASLKAS